MSEELYMQKSIQRRIDKMDDDELVIKLGQVKQDRKDFVNCSNSLRADFLRWQDLLQEEMKRRGMR